MECKCTNRGYADTSWHAQTGQPWWWHSCSMAGGPQQQVHQHSLLQSLLSAAPPQAGGRGPRRRRHAVHPLAPSAPAQTAHGTGRAGISHCKHRLDGFAEPVQPACMCDPALLTATLPALCQACPSRQAEASSTSLPCPSSPPAPHLEHKLEVDQHVLQRLGPVLVLVEHQPDGQRAHLRARVTQASWFPLPAAGCTLAAACPKCCMPDIARFHASAQGPPCRPRLGRAARSGCPGRRWPLAPPASRQTP